MDKHPCADCSRRIGYFGIRNPGIGWQRDEGSSNASSLRPASFAKNIAERGSGSINKSNDACERQ
jgi:hypothetical protein